MKTRLSLFSAALVFGSIQPLAVFGQSHELSILAGAATPSTSVNVLSFSSFLGGASPSVQVDYAYLLRETGSGRLYFELPASRVVKASVGIRADQMTAGTSHFFFTPGVRFLFAPASRLRPYVAGGFGTGWFRAASVAFSPVNASYAEGFKPAVGFGGGAEFGIGRSFVLRAEVRDYVACGGRMSPRNQVTFQGGFGFRF